MEGTVYDKKLRKRVEMPGEMKEFFDKLEELCRNYNVSISHEDVEGGFIIEKYNEENIKWIGENQDKLKAFYNWFNEYKWKQ